MSEPALAAVQCWQPQMAKRGRCVESFTFTTQKSSRLMPENSTWHDQVDQEDKKDYRVYAECCFLRTDLMLFRRHFVLFDYHLLCGED